MHDLFRKKYQEMMEHVEVSEEMRERIMETLEQEAAQAGAGEKTAKTEKTRVGAKKAPSKASPVIYWKKYLSIAASLVIVVGLAFGVTQLRAREFAENSAAPESSAAMDISEDTTEALPNEMTGSIMMEEAAVEDSPEENGSLSSTAPDLGVNAVEGVGSSVEDSDIENISYDTIEDLSAALDMPLEDLTDLPFTVDTVTYSSYNGTAAIYYADRSNSKMLVYLKWKDDTATSMEDFAEQYSGERQITIDGSEIWLSGNTDSDSYPYAFWFDGEYCYQLQFRDVVSVETFTEFWRENWGK